MELVKSLQEIINYVPQNRFSPIAPTIQDPLITRSPNHSPTSDVTSQPHQASTASWLPTSSGGSNCFQQSQPTFNDGKTFCSFSLFIFIIWQYEPLKAGFAVKKESYFRSIGYRFVIRKKKVYTWRQNQRTPSQLNGCVGSEHSFE